ncbi:MAG TPA: Gldg family protein [Polyangia bacterium]|nr:Gldg family protein [Polyangia bacterium]
MSAIFAILRREWEAYFRTPAGWAVLTLFLALQGVVFWMFLRLLASPDAPPGGVMEFFFGGTMMFWIALALLVTVAPMRLVAEELRSGTIEPLLTAPVTAAEVVVGKWLAAVTFFATAWVPTLAYVVYLRATGAALDPGPIAAGYLGTLLLGAAAMAVGVAASALTRYQLVAAALSFVSFFVVLLVGALEGQVRSPDLAAAIRRASLFRMMEDFGHGIVDSRHVVLLVTVTAVALLIAVALLARLRGPLPEDAPRARRLPAWTAALLLGAIAVMVNVLAGRHFARGDWTRESLYDLSPRTAAVLRALPRPVEATIFLYANRDSDKAHAVAERTRAVTGLLRELTQRFTRYAGGRFHAVEVDPDRDPQRAEGAMTAYGIGAYEMSQGVVVFVSGNRSKVVNWEDLVEPELDLDGEPGPTLHAWRGEAAFLSALLTVTSDDPLRVCFSSGHGEPDVESLADGGYGTFAEELRRDGDDVRAIARPGDAAASRCAVLVIAEPTQALAPAEIAALKAYADGGGRLLVMLGPVFGRDGASFAHVGLEDLAAAFGVHLGDNLVVDPSRASDVEGPSVWAAGPRNYRPQALTTRFGGRLTFWPRTREVAPIEPPPPGLVVSPLVQTSAEGWGETDLPTIRGEADLSFDPARDRKGPVSVAVAVERGGANPTRLVFLGTGRLIMNVRLAGLMLRDYDADFVQSAIAWLADRDARVGVGPKPVGRTAPGLTGEQVSWAFRLFVIGLPLLTIVGGALTWWRRRA